MASSLGAFFEILPVPEGAGWRPISDLVDGSDTLDRRIQSTRAVMAASSQVDVVAIDEKAAASVVQLGLVSRLLSPALASATVTGWVPDLSLERVWWKPETYNPVPIAVPEVTGRRGATTHDVVDAFAELVLRRAVRPLVEATSGVVAISPRVLWGNVASALVGAATMINRARPELAASTAHLATALVEGTDLASTGDFGPGGFRRRSCCLFYRVPGAGLCGDCVLQATRTAGRH